MAEQINNQVSSGGGSGLIGGILGGIADLINSGTNIGTAVTNYKAAKEQNAWNRDFSERQFQYAKDLQQQIFAREDNAVQRRVADLQGAGFNKLLSLGQAANAGNIVSTNGASDMSAPQMNMRENKMDNMINMMNLCYNAMKMKQDISLSQTQEDKIRSDIEVNETVKDMNTSNARNKDADTKYYSQREKESNSNISRNSGYLNHLEYQNELIQEKANESRSTQDAIDMKILQDWFDYNMYRSFNLPSGSLHYQGKNSLRSWFLRGGMSLGGHLGGELGGLTIPNKNRNRR